MIANQRMMLPLRGKSIQGAMLKFMSLVSFFRRVRLETVKKSDKKYVSHENEYFPIMTRRNQ
jgi:hypothetical protein